jgi:hypothetical protein
MIIIMSGETGGPGVDVAVDTRSENKPVGVGVDTGSEAKRGEQARARRVADSLIAKKADDVAAKVDGGGGLSKNERALYAQSILRSGDRQGIRLNVKDINTDASDSLSVKNEDDGTSSEISAITDEKRGPDDALIYVCETPAGRSVDIPATDLIAAHAAKNADAIADAFDDNVEQAALVEWSAKNDGSDCPLSADQVATISTDLAAPKETKTQADIDQFISEQIDVLERQIAEIRIDENHPNPDLDRQLSDLLRNCKIATFLKGDGGVFFKDKLLKDLSLQRTHEGTEGAAAVGKIDQLLASIHDAGGPLESAETRLMHLISEGMPGQRVEALRDRIDNGDALAVLQEADVSALAGMNEFLYRNPDVSDNLIKNLLNMKSVDEETKAKLELAKKGGMSLLAILLLLPASAVAAAFEGVSLLSKLNR